MRYASLAGPLLGVYYPLPDDLSHIQIRLALNSSRLAKLWCDIYPESKVDEMIQRYGGVKLDLDFARKLDYDSHKVFST